MEHMENTLLYGIIALTFLVLILAFWVFHLMKKIQKLSGGKNGQSLEKIIGENNSSLKALEKQQREAKKEREQIFTNLENTIQNISVIRFDALGDASGKQSFAIGITDAKKNGVVISSLYTRGGMSVFAKEIKDGSSTHTLTKEEESVIR